MSENYLGWKFPITFNKYSKTVDNTTSLEESIKTSLYLLLTTTQGERIMELEYGCDLNSIMFKPLDLNLKTFISNNIKSAIQKWEPRVNVLDVEVTNERNDPVISINVKYKIIETDIVDSLNFEY